MLSIFVSLYFLAMLLLLVADMAGPYDGFVAKVREIRETWDIDAPTVIIRRAPVRLRAQPYTIKGDGSLVYG